MTLDPLHSYTDPGDSTPEAPRAPLGERIRIGIVFVLLLGAIALFLANQFNTIVRPRMLQFDSTKAAESTQDAEKDMKRILDEYGVSESWIERGTVTFRGLPYVRHTWCISIPRSFPVPSVNYDLKEALAAYGGKTFAVEDARTGEVTLHVRLGGIITHSLCFQPSEGLQRGGGRIAIIVDGIEEASDDELDLYIASNDPIACGIRPHRDLAVIYDRLRVAKKELVLHFHVYEKKPEKDRTAFYEDMTPESVRKRLRSILKMFPGATHYYVTSDLAPGQAVRVIIDEMTRQNARHLESSALTYIDRTADDMPMTTRMNDLASIAASARPAIGVLQLQDGATEFIAGEMTRLHKRGYQFVRLSTLTQPALPPLPEQGK